MQPQPRMQPECECQEQKEGEVEREQATAKQSQKRSRSRCRCTTPTSRNPTHLEHLVVVRCRTDIRNLLLGHGEHVSLVESDRVVGLVVSTRSVSGALRWMSSPSFPNPNVPTSASPNTPTSRMSAAHICLPRTTPHLIPISSVTGISRPRIPRLHARSRPHAARVRSYRSTHCLVNAVLVAVGIFFSIASPFIVSTPSSTNASQSSLLRKYSSIVSMVDSMASCGVESALSPGHTDHTMRRDARVGQG